MCGLSGIIRKNGLRDTDIISVQQTLKALNLRGPDCQDYFADEKVALGHARLSILDTSSAGQQPMTDNSGRYVIVFNGEIFNYQELAVKYLADKNIQFHSTSDTEVMLYLYRYYGTEFVQWLNGFFAFAIYDKEADTIFIARDRYGIKPLYFYQDNEQVAFASEMKALLAFNINKEIDTEALHAYLQLNYIPAPRTIFRQVSKVEPGTQLTVSSAGVKVERYYSLPKPGENRDNQTYNYEQACDRLKELLDASVKRRLISDVPLGAFLSGGIDSSVIVSLAAKHSPHINTFSIGYADEPFFDETKYAELVAKKFKTNHTTFSLTNNDLYSHLFDILDYIDEPFADSSAIAVYILCKQTRQKVTVALSGDGADEMMAGYNKHLAEYRLRNLGAASTLLAAVKPFTGILPKSRQGKLTNLIRQIDRFAEGAALGNKERYWRWCGYAGEQETLSMLTPAWQGKYHVQKYTALKQHVLQVFDKNDALNDVLRADMGLVLQSDMLVKVDLMSMANSLEVRVPFLDVEVVDFVFAQPAEYKLRNGNRKAMLKDAFRADLPEELFNRPKHGFEVPLLKWFRGDLRELIENDLLSPSFIKQQGIFDPTSIQALIKQLHSNDPGESHARIWGLLVFQYWWKKYLA
jgi:asparagine synthase (glutamine-hydrolysing)